MAIQYCCRGFLRYRISFRIAEERSGRVQIIRYIMLPTAWRCGTSIPGSENPGKSTSSDSDEASRGVETGLQFFTLNHFGISVVYFAWWRNKERFGRLLLISIPRTSWASLKSFTSNLFLKSLLMRSIDARLLQAINKSSTYKTMRINSGDVCKVYKKWSLRLFLNPSPIRSEWSLACYWRGAF